VTKSVETLTKMKESADEETQESQEKAIKKSKESRKAIEQQLMQTYQGLQDMYRAPSQGKWNDDYRF